jgi:hypothetical protein
LFGKHFLNVSGRDGRMTGSNRDLMLVGYNVAGGIKPFDRGALV